MINMGMTKAEMEEYLAELEDLIDSVLQALEDGNPDEAHKILAEYASEEEEVGS